MRKQRFETWEQLLTWIGGVPGINRSEFLFSGSKWTQYYRLSKNASESYIMVYGPGPADGEVTAAQIIVVFARTSGKLKRKCIYGMAAYVKSLVKGRNEFVKMKLKSFHNNSLVGKAIMNRKVKKMRAEIAEYDWDNEDVESDELNAVTA